MKKHRLTESQPAAQHTPTPELFVVRIKAVGNLPEKWAIESSGRCYAECFSEPDAEMIVHALNAYHRHAEALGKILGLCMKASTGDPMVDVYEIVQKAMDSYDVQEALAKKIRILTS